VEGLQVIQGDRQSVGYQKSDTGYEFKNISLEAIKGTRFYLATDGYID